MSPLTAMGASHCNSISGLPSRSGGGRGKGATNKSQQHPWGGNVLGDSRDSSGVRSAKLSSVRVNDNDSQDGEDGCDQANQMRMEARIMERLQQYKEASKKKGLLSSFRRAGRNSSSSSSGGGGGVSAAAARSKKIDLSAMGLNMVPAAAVKEMEGVLSLNISQNDPMVVVPDTVVQMSPCLASLQNLDFSKCQIVILPEDWDLPNLLTLDLSHNRIRDFPSQSILKGIPRLSNLNLYANRLTRIPSFGGAAVVVVAGGATGGGGGGGGSNSIMTIHSGESRSSSKNSKNSKNSNNIQRTLIRKVSEREYRATAAKASPAAPAYDANLLENLQLLNVGYNDLTFLPTCLPKNLKSLIASNNYLSQVPPTLILGDTAALAGTIDTTSSSLPKTLPPPPQQQQLPPLQELVISSNPLTYPPLEVCEAGLKAMRKFFEQQQEQERRQQQREQQQRQIVQ